LAKKKRQKRVSPSAEGNQRYARWISGRFLKKATQKLSSKHTAKSQFIYHHRVSEYIAHIFQFHSEKSSKNSPQMKNIFKNLLKLFL